MKTLTKLFYVMYKYISIRVIAYRKFSSIYFFLYMYVYICTENDIVMTLNGLTFSLKRAIIMHRSLYMVYKSFMIYICKFFPKKHVWWFVASIIISCKLVILNFKMTKYLLILTNTKNNHDRIK